MTKTAAIELTIKIFWDMNIRHLNFFFLAVFLGACQHNAVTEHDSSEISGRNYYLTVDGDDTNAGTLEKPWKTIQRLNKTDLEPGDTVYFEGGHNFEGTIVLDTADHGNSGKPVVISSYGHAAAAVVHSGNDKALTVTNTENIVIKNMGFVGSGRKQGNTENGLAILGSRNIEIDSIDIQGYQKAGLLVFSSSMVNITRVIAHDNGFAGIYVTGNQSKNECRDIYIGHCKADNNPGDPTNFTNHSGNGILAGMCRNVTIEYSTATNNGWDMPRQGNGPVGIWTYESDSVFIQHCISYRNKTSAGSADGGGFDLDGGVTNSVIQYCLSYENQGSGIGIFQYAGASDWYNNTIRFNISENDGAPSVGAGVLVWNSSGDAKQFNGCYFYNNTVYNERGAAIKYDKDSEHGKFYFYNNIFIGKDEIITGKEKTDVFIGNDWWSINGGFKIEGFTGLRAWADARHKEMNKGRPTGLNINPGFQDPGKAMLEAAAELKNFNNYKVPAGSPLTNGGADLKAMFAIDPGNMNFNQQPLTPDGIGPCL